MTPMPEPSVLSCSFCDKSQNDVRKLIAGPAVFICDECVEVCTNIIADDAQADGTNADRDVSRQSDEDSRLLGRACALCGFPLLSVEEALGIAERGFLCHACVDAVQAAMAERRPAGSL
jgi:hypothetical protein